MLRKLSIFICTVLQDADFISEEVFDIYVFCFEYILENLLFILTILIFSAIAGNFLTGILFLSVLIPLKLLSGGIHAPSKSICLILSYGISITTILLASVITTHLYFLAFPVYITSISIIFILSPVDTPNKRLDSAQKNKLRKHCTFVLLLFSILFIILFILKLKLYYGTVAICVMIEAINVLLGHLSNRKDTHYEFENSSMR